MKESLELKAVFPAKPAAIYSAWLDSDLHANMTGGDAQCNDIVGASFSTWDEYITGRNIELIENQKIVQTWRTTEFAANDEDSLLTITLNPIAEGTELVLLHNHIPEGQTQYKQGWLNHYFAPMQDFFK